MFIVEEMGYDSIILKTGRHLFIWFDFYFLAEFIEVMKSPNYLDYRTIV